MMTAVECMVCGTIFDYIPGNALTGTSLDSTSSGICKEQVLCVEAYGRWSGLEEDEVKSLTEQFFH